MTVEAAEAKAEAVETDRMVRLTGHHTQNSQSIMNNVAPSA